MKTSLDFRNGFLCVLCQNGAEADRWLPVSKAEPVEAHPLIGRALTQVDPLEGTYVDEEGNVYQLMDKGETKPIEIEPLPGREKTELEVLLEASLKGRKADGQTGGAKRLLRKNRSSGRKQQALQVVTAKPEARPAEAPPTVETSASTFNVTAPEASVQLNLRQKLAEVRRRIGYVQKRGHNERFNYSYVTAADIAGSIGDILAELGVVVIPRLEDISYESAMARGEATRMARVVMAYTFADVDSGEEIIAKVAGLRYEGYPRSSPSDRRGQRGFWLVCFDSLSHRPDELADAACRPATGAASAAGSFTAVTMRRGVRLHPSDAVQCHSGPGYCASGFFRPRPDRRVPGNETGDAS